MSQTLGISYKQREIVLLPFPYSDLTTTKKRPVLIISNNYYNEHFEDVVVCVITSNRYQDTFSVNLSNDDLELGILPEKSLIKTHKLFTVNKSKIIKKFSVIKEELFKKVENQICNLLNNEYSVSK